MKKYRHYKGNIYEVLCEANHSETGEKLIVYKNNQNEVYARPYDMFFDTISLNGELVRRFEEFKE